jgi:polar amino acid transport system substrate-binding protein
MTAEFRVICVDADAPPLFSAAEAGRRPGYEPDVAALVADRLGRRLQWVFRPWPEMIPALVAGEGDVILCGQAITAERRRVVDFTSPYAVFDESVLVRDGGAIAAPGDLRGRRVGALAYSTNMALAETFDGAITVAFDGTSDDVLGVMIEAVRSGDVDALVDDDVALLPAAAEPGLEIAFTVPTRNAWGMAVAKDRPDLRRAVDAALAAAIDDGALAAAWGRWLAPLVFPFEPGR